MAGLAIHSRHRLVGDLSEQVLEEGVLASLGGTGVDLERENLLAGERLQVPVDLVSRNARDGDERLPRERLSDDGRVLEQATLVLGETVQPCGDERVERLRDLECGDRARRPVLRTLALVSILR